MEYNKGIFIIWFFNSICIQVHTCIYFMYVLNRKLLLTVKYTRHKYAIIITYDFSFIPTYKIGFHIRYLWRPKCRSLESLNHRVTTMQLATGECSCYIYALQESRYTYRHICFIRMCRRKKFDERVSCHHLISKRTKEFRSTFIQ